MKVKEIIIEKLKQLGADGLVNSEAECGCDIDDLCPCDSYCLDCEPAIKKNINGEFIFIPLKKINDELNNKQLLQTKQK